ncbi:MAG TPA: hypothetical protein VH476_05500 [Solirubrobacterales bacterium]
MTELEVKGEVLTEEDVEAGPEQPVRAIEPYREAASPILRTEVRTAALAAAGGVLAGAATVAAVRAVGAATTRGAGSRRLRRRRDQRPANIVASRSFLVDVHLLGR